MPPNGPRRLPPAPPRHSAIASWVGSTHRVSRSSFAGVSCARTSMEAAMHRYIPVTFVIGILSATPLLHAAAPEMKPSAELERSVIMNNLKQRYQFRLDEMRRDLREHAVKLAAAGVNMQGRPSMAEIELEQLVRARVEMFL